MFNIEKQIEKWLGINKNVPVVQNDDEEKKKNTKKTTLTTSTSSKESKNEEREEMLNNVKSYYDEIDRIKNSRLIEVEKDENGEAVKKYEEEIKNKVNDKYKPQELKLSSDLSLSEKKAKDKIDSVEYEKNKKLDSVDDKYYKIASDTKDKSIKTGLSRSSILNEMLKDLGEEKLSEYSSIKSDAEKSKQDINKEIENYKTEYKNAIDNLDVKKAIEIKDLLDKYKKENFGSEFVEGDDEAVDKEVNKVYTKIIDEVLNYYYQMSPDEARSAYEEDYELQKLLNRHADTIRGYLRMYA